MEAVDPAVELRVGEDRLDHGVAAAVERAAVVGREHAAHERVQTAVPARAGAPALAGVGRDQHHAAAAGEALDRFAVPVARVGEHDLGRVSHPGGCQLGFGGGDHRFELPEVG